MKNRLDITLFGTQYTVGALFLFRRTIQSGIDIFGRKKWHELMRDIALGVATPKTRAESGRAVGQPLLPVYKTTGIALHERTFGMEVSYRGNDTPFKMVQAEVRELEASMLVHQSSPGDMLSVFWAKRPGVMTFRWENVDEFNEDEIMLNYDTLSPLLAQEKPFELVLDVTWKNIHSPRRPPINDAPLENPQHILHTAQ